MQWAGITAGMTDAVLGRRFSPGDGHALDGIIDAPAVQDLAIWDVNVWDGRGGALQPGRCVVIRGGRICEVVEASRPLPAGMAVLNAALELTSLDEIEARLRDHIARGVDVVKIATTHGDLGFAEARPDLPEEWVREIVRVTHEHGLKVTAHSYGTDGDWAAIRGGVDGIEHLVNVPHELPDEMIEAIASRGIWVTPTLAGSAYSVMTLLRDPDLLYREDDLVTNVAARVRRDLFLVLRLLRLPGAARLLLRHPDPLGKLESWYEHSLANTQKLYQGGVNLAFGTDAPFAFGNFHHSVMNEARALRCAGIPDEAILRMATVGSATALGISDLTGTLQPGMRADAVLLEGDPLADIEVLSRVNLVVKEGRVVYRSDSGAPQCATIER